MWREGYTGITYSVIQRDTATPPWEQLAAILRGQIADGTLPRGRRVPSILSLAGQYGLSPVTVRKALDALKAEGLLVGRSGHGTFVAE